MIKRQSIHGQWSSRWTFILAAAGSAVGLGNIWRFPYVAGEYGGGAFVLVYLGCVLLVGIPIMMSEVLLGRHGRQSPVNTMYTLSTENGLSQAWQYLGWLGMVAGFLILSFYSVIAGWTLEYILHSFSGNLTSDNGSKAGDIFGQLLANPGRLIGLHSLFMIMTIIVVAMGVQRGIERTVKFLMPTLFILLLIMVAYAMSTDGFQEGWRYLFYPDWSKLSAEGFLAALGQAFFSLSLGMGAIMIYGSYLPASSSVTHVSVSTAMADTMVAIMAGLAIFPLVFAYHLEPGSGPGLIFVTLPVAFGSMPYGQIFSIAFFVLLLFAAWTSSISLLEPAVVFLVENLGINRIKAAITVGVTTWLLGIFSALSFNLWADYKLFDKTYFDLMDYMTSNIMLPLGGVLIAIFTAWRLPQKILNSELDLSGNVFRVWLFTLSYIAPLGVVLIFLNAIGIL